jgi:hypothetical protein
MNTFNTPPTGQTPDSLLHQAQKAEKHFWAVQMYLENLATEWAQTISELLFEICDGRWD